MSGTNRISGVDTLGYEWHAARGEALELEARADGSVAKLDFQDDGGHFSEKEAAKLATFLLAAIGPDAAREAARQGLAEVEAANARLLPGQAGRPMCHLEPARAGVGGAVGAHRLQSHTMSLTRGDHMNEERVIEEIVIVQPSANEYHTGRTFGGQPASLGRDVLVKLNPGGIKTAKVVGIDQKRDAPILLVAGSMCSFGDYEFHQTSTPADLAKMPSGCWTWPPRIGPAHVPGAQPLKQGRDANGAPNGRFA